MECKDVIVMIDLDREMDVDLRVWPLRTYTQQGGSGVWFGTAALEELRSSDGLFGRATTGHFQNLIHPGSCTFLYL